VSHASIKSLFRFIPAMILAGALFVPAAPRLLAQESAQPAAAAQSTSEVQSSGAQSSEKNSEKNKEEKDENDVFRHSSSVRAIGAKMGLDPEHAATAFSILNFALLVIFVGWFLVKALPKAFRNRTSTIQKHLVEARSATEEANARLSSVEARLSKLDEQIAAMRAQAEKDLAHDEQRIKDALEEEKHRILTSAEQEIASATTQAQRQLRQYAADLAIDQAAHKLVVNAETDRLIVQDFARRLAGEKEGHN
jgi:F-type H+-transporting ATPase subunit b